MGFTRQFPSKTHYRQVLLTSSITLPLLKAPLGSLTWSYKTTRPTITRITNNLVSSLSVSASSFSGSCEGLTILSFKQTLNMVLRISTVKFAASVFSLTKIVKAETNVFRKGVGSAKNNEMVFVVSTSRVSMLLNVADIL